MRRISIIVAAALFAAGAASAHPMPGMADMPGHHHHDGPDTAEKLGKVSFPTSCTGPSKAGIERGVALLHSFGYVKAQMQFEAVAKADPSCAMAHWGVAMTQYQEIWGQPDAGALKRGADEMAQARALSTNATPREQAYIAALSAFFDPAQPDFQHRADAYEAKMNALHAAYPKDVEAAAFDALAILASTAPTDTSLSHPHRALAILKPLFAAHPDHPGLAHYIIHTCDTPALARDGAGAAKVYARIAPASPHALHMPAHIFARLGQWKADIASNEASNAASKLAENAHEPGAAHQMHAQEFLIYAYLQTGQTTKAKALVDSMAATGDRMMAMPGMDDMKDGGHFFTNELEAIYGIETHDWAHLVTLQPSVGSPSDETMHVYWANAIAAGHLHDAKRAGEALANFDKALDALKHSPHADFAALADVQRNTVVGWKAYAEDLPEAAVAALRAAADQQDKLGQAEVDIPARELLADLLMLEHKPKEALVEYRIALKLSPNRLNGLRGAAEAAKQAGAAREAARYRATIAKQAEMAAL